MFGIMWVHCEAGFTLDAGFIGDAVFTVGMLCSLWGRLVHVGSLWGR